MLKLALVIVAAIVAAALLAGLAANRLWNGEIDREIAQLEAAASPATAVVTREMLEAVPAPVRRYLAHSGVVPGTPIPRLVRLTQQGRIRSAPEAPWMPFEAVQTYSTAPPAFVWKMWMPARAAPLVLGRDAYLGGVGSTVIKALSAFPLADQRGEAMNEASLMRYLNEMMWFPAAFLGDNVRWRALDDRSAEVTLTDRGMSATATLLFAPDGRLERFRATRYNTGTGSLETWETPLGADALLGGLTLPSRGAATWKLGAGDFTYIELDVTEIVFNPAPAAP
ncbi:MAG TPA: hypothetical protein GYA10_13190 [Alphaproteobacteria bacterium]|nr:hypothetical protein [Alphaproteobacteria bacterium]